MIASHWVLPFGLFLAAALTRAGGETMPVSLTEDQTGYILVNQYVVVRVAKHSGDLISMKYRGLELLGAGSGHPYFCTFAVALRHK